MHLPFVQTAPPAEQESLLVAFVSRPRPSLVEAPLFYPRLPPCEGAALRLLGAVKPKPVALRKPLTRSGEFWPAAMGGGGGFGSRPFLLWRCSMGVAPGPVERLLLSAAPPGEAPMRAYEWRADCARVGGAPAWRHGLHEAGRLTKPPRFWFPARSNEAPLALGLGLAPVSFRSCLGLLTDAQDVSGGIAKRRVRLALALRGERGDDGTACLYDLLQ